MIIREDWELERMVTEEEYHIAVPIQITCTGEGEAEFLVYSFCESMAEICSRRFADPLAEEAVTWLAGELAPCMKKLGFEADKSKFPIYREYRMPELPPETELSARTELLSELTEEDREQGIETLEEFDLDPDNPLDRMTVIREDGRIVAFAAVNDMQEDEILEITVECDTSCRRRGYGKACVVALTRYFLGMGREVKYLCGEDNIPSMATAESAGFRLYSRVLPMVYYRQEPEEE